MIKFNFNKKLVLVLASSKGIGFELAKQFALSNAKVCVCSRSQANLNRAKKDLSKITKISDQIKFFKVNLSNPQQLDKLHKKVIKSFKTKIDILIDQNI